MAVVGETSMPRACAATMRTTASSTQLGSVHSAAPTTRREDIWARWLLSTATRVCSGAGRRRWKLPRRRISRPDATPTTIAAGSAMLCIQAMRPSGASNRTAREAMATRDAKSSRRATAVDAAASPAGILRRVARAGLATSPSLKGSRWLASSAACRMANSEKTPPPLTMSCRHANARSPKARV